MAENTNNYKIDGQEFTEDEIREALRYMYAASQSESDSNNNGKFKLPKMPEMAKKVIIGTGIIGGTAAAVVLTKNYVLPKFGCGGSSSSSCASADDADVIQL